MKIWYFEYLISPSTKELQSIFKIPDFQGTKGTKIMIQGKMPQYYFSQQGLPCRMKIIENIVRNKIKCTALFWTNLYLKSYLWYTSWASNIESKFQKSKVCVILYCFLKQGHVHVRHVNDNNYLTDNNILLTLIMTFAQVVWQSDYTFKWCIKQRKKLHYQPPLGILWASSSLIICNFFHDIWEHL